MSEKTWTINCCLAGAHALIALQRGEKETAHRILRELTSELTDMDVDYLLTRLAQNLS